MIAFIIGTVAQIDESSMVLENHGMGYRVYMTATDLATSIEMGMQVKVYTYFHVKEDLMQLYGFLSEDDLEVFTLLLGVNGIGPKGALGVLSALSADQLRFAVLSDDVALISKAPGVGKKTALKLILELKDKLKLEDAFEKKLTHVQQAAGKVPSNHLQEAVQALEALGYTATESLRAVQQVENAEQMDVEVLLKAALKALF